MNRLALAPTSLPDAPPLEFIAAAAAAGFDDVGLRLHRSPLFAFHPVVGNASLIAEMKRALADSGMKVLDILSFYLQPVVDFEEMRQSLALAAEFGGRYPMAIGDDPEWPRLRDNFGRFCDEAISFGLTPAVEFALLRPLHTLPQALQLIAETGRGKAVLSLDPVNLIRSGGTIEQLKTVDRKLLPYGQLADGLLGPGEPDLAAARRNGASERRLPGEGMLPLHDYLKALPPDVPLSLELPPPTGATYSAAQWAKIVADSTRRFLGTAAHAIPAARPRP